MTTVATSAQEVQLLLEEAEQIYATDPQRYRSLAQQGLELCRTLDEPQLLAKALDLAGYSHQQLGMLTQARELIQEKLILHLALGDQSGIGACLRNLGDIARWMGEFDKAEKLIRQSIATFTDLKDVQQLALSVNKLHGVLVYGGQFAKSVRLFDNPELVYRDDIDLLEEPNKPTVVSAFALMHLGRYEEAMERFKETALLYPQIASYSVKNLGRIALAQGKYDNAQTHLLEALALFRQTEDMNGLGQTLGCLGMTALRLGNRDQAREYVDENLQIAAKTLIILPSLTALCSLALLRATDDQGDQEGDQLESAIELYASASNADHVANSRWYDDAVGQSIDAAAKSLSPDTVKLAKGCGRASTWQSAVRNNGLV